MPEQWRSAAICAGATALLGLICLSVLPLRFWFDRLSYDLPFSFTPETALNDVVVVKYDEKSYRDLNQDYNKLWDRALEAQLIDHLTADKAKLVVFDVYFADPGTPEKNAQLAAAIRKNGHVVLGMEYREYPKLAGGEPIYPREEFKNAAAACGIVPVIQDKADGVVRQINPGDETHLTLPWAAAAQWGISSNRLESRSQFARWLNYPALDQFRWISYSEALAQEPGFFADKVVFIGGSPRTKMTGQQTDEFPTPFGIWSGVFIQAASFLNLIHGTWLERPPSVLEMFFVLIQGMLAAAMFSLVRPWLGAIIAVALLFLVFAGACALVVREHQWFSWMIVAGAEIPFAFTWSVVVQARRLAREKALVDSELQLERQAVERLLPVTESEAPTLRSDVPAEPGTADNAAAGTILVSPHLPQHGTAGPSGVKWLPPSVPDHTLVRCIGEGGYGQVWLARDVIGTHHAVKFVYRKTFNNAGPFEREFKGIHHFTPISRMHPGFVHILHVGRNEKAEYFFYIMELADDENTRQEINPATYVAKTLSRVIRTKGRLEPTDCVRLGLELSSALQYLHEHRLIHRDIKPSNVLYIHGHAKFADVGLVTQIDTRRPDATYIGTEGYIAPEGPGTAAADVYSLGKVLYEASLGLDRMRFPDLPTTIIDQPDPLVLRLNQIVLKACEFNPTQRYKSAQELYDDLKTVATEQKIELIK
jgi:CHASE2 domain-containing sensor protein